jgi:cytoskeletal protein CcmA (bactofilin family)
MIWRRGDRREDQATPAPGLPTPDPGREQPKAHLHEGRKAMAEDQDVTVVGRAARLEGNIFSARSLRIDGQIKGQIEAEGDVTVSPQGEVEADIKAENVTVAGQFRGSIVVKGRAELAQGGRVDGDITCTSLIVQEGAVFQGQSIMDREVQASQQGRASQAGAKPAQQGQRGGAPIKVPEAETSDV